MKNRAKCKLCQSVIESFHSMDYVSCKCGHISVDGGDAMRCSAIDWSNFMRVDDEGNEIIVKVKNDDDVKRLYIEGERQEKLSKDRMLEMLEEMIKSYESLPENAKRSPVTHYDLISVLLLFSSIFRA